MFSNRAKSIYLVLSCISILVLSTAVIILCVIMSLKNPRNICETDTCINSANSILKKIDTSVDPCDDFYQFSCGVFLNTKRIPGDRSYVDDSFSVLINNLNDAVLDALEIDMRQDEPTSSKNVKRLYQSCLNETQIETDGEEWLKSLLFNEFGGWTLINQTSNSTDDYIELMAKFQRLHGHPIFHIDIIQNPNNRDVNIIKIQQANWLLTRKQYNNAKVLKAYKALIVKLVTGLSPFNFSIPIEKIQSMIDLEISFAKSTYDSAQRDEEDYKIIELGKLNKKIPEFDWIDFIRNGLYSELEEVSISDIEPILYLDWNYIKDACKLYTDSFKHNKEDLSNLMIWSFIKEKLLNLNFLPKNYTKAFDQFNELYLSEASTVAIRTQKCASIVTSVMPFSVGQLYVSRNFKNKSKTDVEEMVENIREEFKTILNNTDWMDDVSKKAAIEKANLIDAQIGFPNFTYNSTYLDSIYIDYVFDSNNYLENVLVILKSNFKRTFNSLREKSERTSWNIPYGPATVNGFYKPDSNQIFLPAGILHHPFYDPHSPNYLNYGGIGSVIGHEITHGFDNHGRLYDKLGVYYADGTPGLWSNKTIENFINKSKCLIDQYSSFVSQQVNSSVNGKLTLGENIADNGGIKEAYGSYKKWLSKRNLEEPLLPGLKYDQNQLFFINYAQLWCSKYRNVILQLLINQDVHSPGQFRILGPTSNYEEFYKAFKCKSKSKVKKCSVW